jgi:hypothetical protein
MALAAGIDQVFLAGSVDRLFVLSMDPGGHGPRNRQRARQGDREVRFADSHHCL